MKGREAFISDFGALKGEHWVPEMEKWVYRLEKEGGSMSNPGHYSISVSGGSAWAEIFMPGRSAGKYTWRIPGYKEE